MVLKLDFNSLITLFLQDFVQKSFIGEESEMGKFSEFRHQRFRFDFEFRRQRCRLGFVSGLGGRMKLLQQLTLDVRLSRRIFLKTKMIHFLKI